MVFVQAATEIDLDNLGRILKEFCQIMTSLKTKIILPFSLINLIPKPTLLVLVKSNEDFLISKLVEMFGQNTK